MHVVRTILSAFMAAFAIGLIAWASAAPARIVIIGDSTVMTYDSSSHYPQSGWGQMLGFFFRPGAVSIDNRAIGGRSSRSFYQEGRWAAIVPTLKPGDFVFIQFGHNDRGPVPERHTDTAAYKDYLGKYVTEARAKGALPVLVTPMNMNTWKGTTLQEVFTEDSNDYRGAMLHVASALRVPAIDLEQSSKALFQSLGQAYCGSFLFMGLAKGEYPAFPAGISDNTHFQVMGALEMAKAVAAGIATSPDSALAPLARALAPLYPFAVASDKAGAGVWTRASAYPAGAPLVIKVSPESGETFLGWKDAGGKTLARDTTYHAVMPAAAVSYTAVFKGASAGVRGPFPEAAPSCGAAGRDAMGRAGSLRAPLRRWGFR